MLKPVASQIRSYVEMLFNNLLLAVTLTVLWPLGLLGVLAAAEWLERRTLATEEIVPRRLQRMANKPPEPIEAMVAEETASVVAAYWSATGRPVPPGPPATAGERATGRRGGGGGRHLRQAGGGRGGGRHTRRG
jgi:hypothetical protein